GNQGEDILLGDHGRFDYLFEGATVTDVVEGSFAEIAVPVDTDPTTLDVVTTTDPTEGGDDRIVAGTGNDLVFGGTGSDTIDGDDGQVNAQTDGTLDDGAADILLGDHGIFYTALPQEKRYQSIDTGTADGGGNDTIRGNQGDDKILGQQGDDQLFGEAGEDDIIGGHNVRGGADGDDLIEGGEGADVMLGDNGLITRRIQPDGTPERHPSPFADVIRDVVRFDDNEAVGPDGAAMTSGNDIIRGGAGDDIGHGQRGDDTLDGGAGDDELYGELGNDNIEGGDGRDTLLGDSGFISRALNEDGTPRLNENGAWHRDVILTEVGQITRNDDIGEALPEDARAEDIWLLTSGNRLLSVALEKSGESAGNDVISGGAGEDAIFGQLGEDEIDGGGDRDYIEGNGGDDRIEGGGGDDIIIGDDGANLVAFETEAPVVRRGFHLIGQADGIDTTLGDFGTVVLPQLTIRPKTLDNIAPTVGFAATVNGADNNIPPIGPIRQTNGDELTVLASVVPGIGDRSGEQAGQPSLFSSNDEISDSSGNNTIVGDNAINITPLRTGDDEVDARLDTLVRDIYQTSYALHDLELGIAHRDRPVPVNWRIGNDTITGGSNADWIVGDDHLFFGPFLTQPPLNTDGTPADTATLINSLSIAVNGLKRGLEQRLATLPIESTDYIPGQLEIANDTINGGDGSDRIIGDDQVTFAPVVENITNQRDAFWDYGFGTQRTQRTQPLRGFDLITSNDTLAGEDGKDLIVGDNATTITPVIEATPTNRSDQRRLENSVNQLIEDIEQYLRDQYEDDYGIDFSQRDQSSTVSALNDNLRGNQGDDLILGDNASFRQPMVAGEPDFGLRLNSDRINTEDDSYNFFHGLPRQVELAFREPGNSGPTTVANDIINGDEGEDILFGLNGVDQLTGGINKDFLFGGKEDDTFNSNPNFDVVRQTGPGNRDFRTINPVFDEQLETLLSPATRQYLKELRRDVSQFVLRGDLDARVE
ncbi:MAG: hypothetical protein AAFU53_02830, partial [Cyanobacteria bacterium J06632_3]